MAHILVALALVFLACAPSPETSPEPTVQRSATLAAAPGWTASGAMLQPRSGHTATLLPSGKVLAVAGDFGGSSNTAEVYDPATGTWSATGSLAQARYGHTATLLPGGKVLVAGGLGNNVGAYATAEVYDPATERWTVTGSMTQTRYGHTATLLPDGKVLVVGGASISTSVPGAELYDPATGTWTATGSLAQARMWHTATLLPNGKVLVAGGEGTSSNGLVSAELYDPASGTWTPTGALTEARANHTATLLPQGKVLVVGGRNPYASFPTHGEVYDPATGTWSVTRPLSQTRYGHTATLLPDGTVLVAGGGTRTVEVYDPTSGSWTPARPLLWSRFKNTATLLPDGKVLVAGRIDGAYSSSQSELYDATTGDWAATRPLAQARASHTATLLPQGKVLVAGGDANNTSVAQAELYDPANGTWTNTAPLSQARSRHTATLLPQGRVLVVGGHADNSSLAHTEVYDPATGAWAPTTPLTQARESHTATLLLDGKVLVVGGLSDTSPLASAEVYNPATGTWAPTAPMIQARSRHSATLLPDGKVLVVGGLNDTGFLASAEVYDPATGTWAPTGSLAQAGAHHTATLLPGGKVLIAGGDFDGAPLSRAELYDPATGTWTSTGSLAQARESHSATLLRDGRVLVSGGGGSASTSLASAEVYLPASGTWALVRSPAQARSSHTATLLPDGKVLMAGGDFNNGPLTSTELYDPVLGTWNATGSMTQARSNHTATLLPGGKVLVTGGYANSSYLSSAELYEPVTGTWTATGSMANARIYHTATLLTDGRVLIVGGGNFYTSPSVAEVYNPATGTWTATGAMVQARSNHTATLLHNGRVLVAGGNSTASAEVYDPVTNTWAATGPLTQQRDNHTATLLPDGKVLVVGGTYYLGSTEVYDPATGTWTLQGRLAQGRSLHTATLLPDGKVLVAGGFGDSGALTSAEVYDPTTGTWVSTGALTQARYRHLATLLPDGKVLVTGGRETTSYLEYLASTEVYDPTTGAWTPTGPMTQPREFHTVTLLSDGRVLATGGSLDGVATAEVYQQQWANPAWRPVIASISPSTSLETSTVFTVNGSYLRKPSEAGSGTTSSSPSDAPLLTLRDLSRGGVMTVPFQDFSSTHITASVPQVPPGRYVLAVTVNGLSATQVLTLTSPPDTTPPTVTLMTEGTTLSNTATLRASASDNRSVTRVEFYDGSTLLGADLVPPFSISWDTRTTTNGTHLLTAKAFDAAGRSATSTAVGVTLDNDLTPPTVNITAPGAGAIVTGTVTAAATAHDNMYVDRVEYYDGSRLLCVSYFDASTCGWNTRLGPNGDRTLTVKAYDFSGNVGVATVTVTANNDITPAVALTAPTEGVTLTGTVLLTATASQESGISRVDFFAGSTLVGTASTAPYSLNYNTRNLPNGTWALTARAYGTLNNVGTSAPVNVTFDNDLTPPTVALTAPASGSTLSGTVILTATASDPAGISQVAFFVGSTLVGTASTAPYSLSYDTRNLSNSTWALTAKAYDAAGNEGSSAPVNVTFNNDFTPPSVALTAPTAGAKLVGTVTLSATASDNVAVTRVEFYDGSTLLGTVTSAPYGISWDSSTVANGAHVLTAKAYDAAGYVTPSTSVSVTVDNDEVPPAVAFSVPTAGAILSGTTTLTATATDNVAVTRVEFYDGATRLSTDTAAPYTYGWNTLTASNGEHTLSAKAYDAKGNVGVAEVTVTVNNDFTPPTVALTAPAEGDSVSGTIVLTATASDNKAVTRVAFFVGTTQVGTDTTAPYSYSYNTRLLSNGDKVLTAKAYDAANNVGTSAPVDVSFDNDFTPPVVTLTAPAEGDTLTGTVTFTATASDNKAVTRVAFFVGTTQVGTDTTEPFTYSYNTRLLSNGDKVLTAKAYDAVNNVGTSAPVNVTFDNDFTGPTVELTAPGEGDTLTGTVTFTATASDPAGISKVAFFVGTIQVGTDTTEPFSCSYNSRSLTNGAKVVTAKAYDAFNNVTTSAAVNVTIDNDFTAPTTSILSPVGGATVSGVVQIDASASDDRGTVTKVEFYQGATLLGSVTTAPYRWAWDTTKAPIGNNILKTRAWDPAGNSAYSATVTVNVVR